MDNWSRSRVVGVDNWSGAQYRTFPLYYCLLFSEKFIKTSLCICLLKYWYSSGVAVLREAVLQTMMCNLIRYVHVSEGLWSNCTSSLAVQNLCKFFGQNISWSWYQLHEPILNISPDSRRSGVYLKFLTLGRDGVKLVAGAEPLFFSAKLNIGTSFTYNN